MPLFDCCNEPWGFYVVFNEGSTGPGAFSDGGSLLFHEGLASGVLLGRVCLGNVTNIALKYSRCCLF